MLEKPDSFLERLPIAGPLIKRYRKYVKWILTSGNITDTSPFLVALSRWIMRGWSYLQVGRIKVVNYHNLITPGRIIYCPNHGSYLDAIVVGSIMQRPVRYMGAYESLDGLFGIKPIVCCKVGAFAVDRSRGKTVLKPATDLLVSGQPLMIFPEGKINNSGKLSEFKLGPGYITKAAVEQLGDDVPVGIVPMHICYHKRDFESGETFNFCKMGLKWRGGCTVFAGDPIWVNRLEDRNPHRIMELVRKSILSFDCSTSGACMEEV